MNAKCRVLFLDDDTDVRTAIGQSLELAGYDVVLCRAYIEAIDYLSAAFAGVIVTDIRMPGKDGFDFLARCQKVDPDLPVIVLTGEADVPMAVDALSKGAVGFLEKPCPPTELQTAIERAWTKRRAVLEGRDVAGLAPPASRTASVPLSARLDLVERDLLEAALTEQRGRIPDICTALGLPRKTLYDKLKRHGLDPAIYRD